MILLDGPMGTLLEHHGVPTPPPRWTASALDTHPDAVQAVHRAYADAGAVVHTAATFRTRPAAVGDDARRLSAVAVALCRQAVPASHRVAGSVAPVADCYEPWDSPPDAPERHARFARLLADVGVDLLLVETFAHPGEALAATEAAVATGLPVWSALTAGPRAMLLDPAELAAAARRLADAGAEVVLVNCTRARAMTPYVDAVAALGIPWGAYANAGPVTDGLQHGTPGAAEAYASLAESWSHHGPSVLGSCCMTGPEHIRLLDRRFSSNSGKR